MSEIKSAITITGVPLVHLERFSFTDYKIIQIQGSFAETEQSIRCSEPTSEVSTATC